MRKNVSSQTAFAAAAVAMLLSLPTPAAGQSRCPVDEPVTPESIHRAARQVYAQGPGEGADALVGGMKDAAGAVPGRVRSIGADVAPEFQTDGRSQLNEYQASVSLGVSLGKLGRRQRDVWSGRAETERAQADRRRAEWLFEMQSAYIDWWVAELERRHLAEYLTEVRSEFEPLRKATERKQITRLDLADFEVELGRIKAERSQARRRAEFARAEVRRMLGGSCELAAPSEQPSELEHAAEENPWRPLLERVDQFPRVQAVLAQRRQALREARASRSENAAELSVGVGARSVGFDEYWAIPTVGLSVPIGNDSAPQAEAAAGRAASLSIEHRWEITQLRGELRAAAERWEATRTARRDFMETYVEPLRKRVELFQSALDTGRIELQRLIRAHRDLHEAEHSLLNLRADLMARTLKAKALSQVIQQDSKGKQ